MNAAQKNIFCWPEAPGLPPLGQPVLIRVVTSQSRQTARQELRMVLRQTLAAWSGLSPEHLPLIETSRGPVWLGQLNSHTLDISLSYADSEGWIGFLSAGSIGVDAMRIQPIPEAEAVARHYLGLDALAAIQQSNDPAKTFAEAWTGLEARIKCLKQELNEWSVTQTFCMTGCALQSLFLPDNQIVAVATRFGPVDIDKTSGLTE